ncbi:4322_t:CDS:2 [Funneliformis geosporum]|uniref:12646_t:CDS:1 n=1 Tax=Funneliformis geosporum TaxID=1117311 RepID=A0A9W4WTZ3_9GLOM|nr:4322_t:CDS:2 [Funneliformis geosporum]CAI2185742.1 12646_t:CDS:2 [Funneliformis geosporum]
MEVDFTWSKTCDAHTHAHDDVENLEKIGNLKTNKVCLMGTRLEDLDVVSKLATDFQEKVIPCFGFHPWFCHLLSLEDEPSESKDHYRTILKDIGPKVPSRSNYLEEFINTLPSPTSFNTWYSKLENLLKTHPNSLLGEVGLDKTFRLRDQKLNRLSQAQTTLKHQTAIFEKQLDLAAKYKRAVSMHCVQSTGAITQLLNKKIKGQQPLPPRICLHSFGGSVDTIKALVKQTKGSSLDIYFSFSIVINDKNSRLPDLIRAVPEDKLLIETDYHSPNGLDYYMTMIIKLVSEVKEWTETTTVDKTRENFIKFIGN